MHRCLADVVPHLEQVPKSECEEQVASGSAESRGTIETWCSLSEILTDLRGSADRDRPRCSMKGGKVWCFSAWDAGTILGKGLCKEGRFSEWAASGPAEGKKETTSMCVYMCVRTCVRFVETAHSDSSSCERVTGISRVGQTHVYTPYMIEDIWWFPCQIHRIYTVYACMLVYGFYQP